MSVPDIDELVTRLYAALREGDRDGLFALLDDGFVGELSPGMPLGLGGRRAGAAAMGRDGWGAIGRAFAAAPEEDERVACADGRLLVVGVYRGSARSTGRPLEATFTHLWTARDGRLVHLRQTTDTAAWVAALEPA